MNRFTPTIQQIDPAEQLDPLAAAVLQTLGRQYNTWLSWGILRTMLLGLLTLGIAPLVILPLRLRRFAGSVKGEFWHLAEWLRVSGVEPAAAEIRDEAARIDSRGGLAVAQWMVMGVFGSAALSQVIDPSSDSDAARAIATWAVGVLAASVLHVMHVRAVWSDIERFVDRYNTATRSLPTPPLLAIGPGLGLRPAWIISGVGLAILGMPWLIPVMVAAAAQRRMISYSVDNVRAQLAKRLRTMLIWRRPQVPIPVPASLRRACTNRMCKVRLPAGARFCPRCGTTVAVALEAVA